MADVSLLTRKLIQSVSKLSESRIKMPLAVGDIVKEKQVISGNVATVYILDLSEAKKTGKKFNLWKSGWGKKIEV